MSHHHDRIEPHRDRVVVDRSRRRERDDEPSSSSSRHTREEYARRSRPTPAHHHPSDPYGIEEDRNTRYHESPHPPGTQRRHHTDRPIEGSDDRRRRHHTSDRGRDSRHEHSREEFRTTRVYYVPPPHEGQAPCTSSSRAHVSHPHEDEREPRTSSSRTHDSRSHEKERKPHKSSSRAHASNSHEDERKRQKSSGRTHSPSETPGPSQKTRRGNSKASSSADSQSKTKDVPNSSADNIPLPIQQALAKGRDAMAFLKYTIDVVLLYEWCFAGHKLHTNPGAFKSSFKVIPVERDNFGQFQPIEDTRSKWGVKTEYDPQYNTYLATILIRVPSVLAKVTHAQLKSAYRRFAVEPRVDRLDEIHEIPFKDHPEYRKYAILFRFKSGSEKPRLFDDYLLEDAVIKI